MDLKEKRIRLKESAVKILNFIETEFKKADLKYNVQIKFENGFRYGWKSDYLCLEWKGEKQQAEFFINHNYGKSLIVKSNGDIQYIVITGEIKDATKDFTTNFQWDSMHELQDAIEILLNNWHSRLKPQILEKANEVWRLNAFEV